MEALNLTQNPETIKEKINSFDSLQIKSFSLAKAP